MTWLEGIKAGSAARIPRAIRRNPSQTTAALTRASLARQGKSSAGGYYEPGHPEPWHSKGGDKYNPRGIAAQGPRITGGGAFGGGQFPGGNFNMPPYQDIVVNIPNIPVPQPPKVERLTRDELYARVMNDPDYIADKALQERKYNDAISQIRAAEELANKQNTYSMDTLRGQERQATRDLRSDLIGRGMETGTIASTAEGQLRQGFQQQYGQLGLNLQNLLSQYAGQRQTAGTQNQENLANSLQNAANRYLSRRVTPTEVSW